MSGFWEAKQSVQTSSIESKYYCSFLHRPRIEWSSRSYIHIECVKSLVTLTLKFNLVLDWFWGYHIVYINNLSSHEPFGGELLWNIIVYQLKHIIKQGQLCATMFSLSQVLFHWLKMKRHSTVHENKMGYNCPSFQWMSLQPSIYSTTLPIYSTLHINFTLLYCQLFVVEHVNVWICNNHGKYSSAVWSSWIAKMSWKHFGIIA